MVEWTHQQAGETGMRLIVGILLIVVTGIALGISYNALQQAGNPVRALAWVRQDVPLKSLEEMQGVPADPSAGGRDTGDVPPPTARPPQAEGGIAAAAAAAQKPAAKPAGETASQPAPKPTAVTPAPTAPADAAKSEAAPVTPPLPTIPEVKEPLDAKLATVKQFFDARAAVIVDARTPGEYAEGHIQGAVSLPFDDVAHDESLLKRFDAGGKPVIVYCSGGDCELSKDLAGLLIGAGQRKVLVYMGGYPEWAGAGYPTAKGAAGEAR